MSALLVETRPDYYRGFGLRELNRFAKLRKSESAYPASCRGAGKKVENYQDLDLLKRLMKPMTAM